MIPKLPAARFDSSTALLKALAAYLHGDDFPGLGLLPRWSLPALRPLANMLNRLPEAKRLNLYTWGGWREVPGGGKSDRRNSRTAMQRMIPINPSFQAARSGIGGCPGPSRIFVCTVTKNA